MLGYFLKLALASLRRNLVITTLMVAAVGVGIGASMTVYAVLRAMSGNPIPEKSDRLFIAQIDAWGPQSRSAGGQRGVDRLPGQLTYRDALALMDARHAPRQAVMYAVTQDITPREGRPFRSYGRATYGDFFAMFDVPFRSGGVWSVEDEAKHESVVVLGTQLAQRAFPHGDPVGQVINLSDHDYRVVGVVQPWVPMPRFYDLNGGAFAQGEQFFIPFTTAVDRHINSSGGESCQNPPTGGWDVHLNSDCLWLQFWAELPTAAMVRDYQNFLHNYAAEQQQLGRFHWPARAELRDVEAWLLYNDVVPPAIRAIGLVADGFLIVCLVNAVGLLLAKFSARASDLALRRALGASRSEIFEQCATETLLVGVLGGLVGLLLTALGLAGLRALLGAAGQAGLDVERLVSLDMGMVVITLVVAVLVTVCAGLYPTWRASRVQPAWQLKAP